MQIFSKHKKNDTLIYLSVIALKKTLLEIIYTLECLLEKKNSRPIQNISTSYNFKQIKSFA